ncbi:MAG: hypothetical protein ED859_17155, partial [Desulfuromonadales bacterium]
MLRHHSFRYLHHTIITLAALSLAPTMVLAADLIVSVKTDKPTYQPGQKVTVTALVKTTNGTPATSAKRADLSISIPSGSAAQSGSMTSTGNGYYSYSYTLSTSAAVGTWKANAVFETSDAGGTGSTSFAVAKAPVVTTPPPMCSGCSCTSSSRCP